MTDPMCGMAPCLKNIHVLTGRKGNYAWSFAFEIPTRRHGAFFAQWSSEIDFISYIFCLLRPFALGLIATRSLDAHECDMCEAR